jgi:hypothetical protein
MTPGSSADATVRGSAARAQSGRALCRPCNRPMPSRRETKAVVHGGAPQRSLLGESACSPNLLGRQPRASDGITVHRHAREQHGGGVPVRDSRFPRQSAHLAATGSDTVEIRPEQESDQARSGLPPGPLAPLAGGWNPAGRASISAPRPPHRFVWRSGVLDAATPRSAGRATWCHLAYCRFRRVRQQTHEPAARVLPASIAEAVGRPWGARLTLATW